MVLCSVNIGNIGEYGISSSYVFICGSLIDKSKPIASVWIVAFVLFVPGGDCRGLDDGGVGAC